MEPVIHLVTREFPFGRGEAFAADDAARLRSLARVVVVPAFPTAGGRQSMPDHVELDESLANRPLVGARSSAWWLPILRGTIRDLRRMPSWPVRPRAVHAMAGYAIRGARAASWAQAVASATNGPVRILSTWSNAEAFGIAMAARRDPRIRLVCRAHGFDVDETVYPGGHLPFRASIAEASLALGPISEAGAAMLRARHPDAISRILVARLGVDRPEVSPPSGDLTSERPWVVATCSRDHPVKRLDLVADAIVAAARIDPTRRWTWLHLGDGGDRLAARVRASDPEVEVIAPGFVDRLRIFEAYRHHRPRVFVNLSSSEGVPVTIMEALSMGVPVVATEVGGTGELVDDRVGRLLPDSVDALAAGRAIVEVAEAASMLHDAAIGRWRDLASGEAAAAALARLVAPLLEPA